MLIITVAPTGSRTPKEKVPNLPITPEEIANQCIEAYEAGASVAHIHVRDPKTFAPSQDVKLYREVVDRIQEKCDIVIQLSTGAGGTLGASLESRMQSLELNPELASLSVATMTFGDNVFLNPPSYVEKLAKLMLERSIKPELECYDVGHINLAFGLLTKGLLTKPLRISLVLGTEGGIPATPKNLIHMTELLPPDVRWQVICVGGKMQFKILALGMVLGGDIRVGMEDNFYLEKGVQAKNNAELVAKAASIATKLGFEIATPAEARKLIGINKRYAGK